MGELCGHGALQVLYFGWSSHHSRCAEAGSRCNGFNFSLSQGISPELLRIIIILILGYQLSLLVPNTRQGRSTAIGNKSLREAVYAAYGPIIEFGRQIGHEDEAYAFYESTADRQPQQVQISGTVEPAKPLVGLRELCQWRAEDYGDQLYRSGTASQAAKFLSSLEGTLKDLQSGM